jgi:hypothetical protein
VDLPGAEALVGVAPLAGTVGEGRHHVDMACIVRGGHRRQSIVRAGRLPQVIAQGARLPPVTGQVDRLPQVTGLAAAVLMEAAAGGRVRLNNKASTIKPRHSTTIIGKGIARYGRAIPFFLVAEN